MMRKKKQKPLKIYFAASISGGRQDTLIYKELINYLSSFGTVLTEKIGDKSLSHLGEDLTDKFIHEQDMSWLKESHIVISEVTTPSLGVGYELSKSQIFGKPTLCLFRPDTDRRLSSMIAGAPGYTIRNYEKIDEARTHIDEFITNFLSERPYLKY